MRFRASLARLATALPAETKNNVAIHGPRVLASTCRCATNLVRVAGLSRWIVSISLVFRHQFVHEHGAHLTTDEVETTSDSASFYAEIKAQPSSQACHEFSDL